MEGEPCVSCSGTLRVGAGKEAGISGLAAPEAVNLLELRPRRRCRWRRDSKGNVILEVKRFRHDWSRRLGYFLDFKPHRRIHLDERGTAVWTLMDGRRSVGRIAEVLEARFGEDEHLLPRLSEFLRMLEINGLAELAQDPTDRP